jgi:hypothetical protein
VTNWLRRLACRWLDLVPAAAPKENSWEGIADAWACKNHKVTWPRVTMSEVWRTELEPYYRQMLLSSLVRLAHETDADKLRMLQERAKLLNEWLETPRLAEARMNAALDNALGSGDKRQLRAQMERAQGDYGRERVG